MSTLKRKTPVNWEYRAINSANLPCIIDSPKTSVNGNHANPLARNALTVKSISDLNQLKNPKEGK